MTDVKSTFNALAFLVRAGMGRRIVYFAPGEALFNQGDSADAVFYLQQGHAKVTVVSRVRKQATVALLSVGDFAGEDDWYGSGVTCGNCLSDLRFNSAQDIEK